MSGRAVAVISTAVGGVWRTDSRPVLKVMRTKVPAAYFCVMGISDRRRSLWARERQAWVEKPGAWLGLALLAIPPATVVFNPDSPKWLVAIMAVVAVLELILCVLVYRARRRFLAESELSKGCSPVPAHAAMRAVGGMSWPRRCFLRDGGHVDDEGVTWCGCA